MVAVFRNLYQNNRMCIWSNPGLYDEGMAYWRETKTKIPFYCFWCLGCWSKGQMFSRKLEDPYIWTQLYLTADTNRLIVFQFSISTLHILNYFLLPEQRSSMKRPTPAWRFSPTLAHGLQLWQQHLSCLQHSSQAFLRAWAQYSHSKTHPALKSFELQAPSKHLHCDKASPCAKRRLKSHTSIFSYFQKSGLKDDNRIVICCTVVYMFKGAYSLSSYKNLF